MPLPPHIRGQSTGLTRSTQLPFRSQPAFQHHPGGASARRVRNNFSHKSCSRSRRRIPGTILPVTSSSGISTSRGRCRQTFSFLRFTWVRKGPTLSNTPSKAIRSRTLYLRRQRRRSTTHSQTQDKTLPSSNQRQIPSSLTARRLRSRARQRPRGSSFVLIPNTRVCNSQAKGRTTAPITRFSLQYRDGSQVQGRSWLLTPIQSSSAIPTR